jgi:hypothetical protein
VPAAKERVKSGEVGTAGEALIGGHEGGIARSRPEDRGNQFGVVAQVAPPSGGSQPKDKGIREAVREGIVKNRREGERVLKIAGITPEAHEAARAAGLTTQTDLLKLASYADGDQVEAVATIVAEKAKAKGELRRLSSTPKRTGNAMILPFPKGKATPDTADNPPKPEPPGAGGHDTAEIKLGRAARVYAAALEVADEGGDQEGLDRWLSLSDGAMGWALGSVMNIEIDRIVRMKPKEWQRYVAYAAQPEPEAEEEGAPDTANDPSAEEQTTKPTKAKRRKPKSKPQRWEAAIGEARDKVSAIEALIDELESALEEVRSIQGEYSDWKDNLHENLASSATGEMLETGCDFDFDFDAEQLRSAVSELDSVLEEAEGADLPRGFGRD